MPHEQDGKEDIVHLGQINLENQTFTNFGPKEYQVTGYFEEIEEEGFDQLYTCEILNIQNASENFTSEVNESLENKNTLSVKNRGGDLQLDLNFQTNLDQSVIDQVKNSTPENPVTLTLNKRFLWADFGPGPCFSMYLVEDVQ
jgi:predicted RNA-binding protein Jag